MKCHTVQINDDNLCEQPPQDFFSQLTYIVGGRPITVDPDRARVVINDDTEDECGEYKNIHTMCVGRLSRNV